MKLFGVEVKETTTVACPSRILDEAGWEWEWWEEGWEKPDWVVFHVDVTSEGIKGWVYYIYGEFAFEKYNNAAPVGSLKDYGVTLEFLQRVEEHDRAKECWVLYK